MIRIRLNEQLARRRLSIVELSDRTGISVRNLETLREQKAVAIRFKTLDTLCRALRCQPQDLIEWQEAAED